MLTRLPGDLVVVGTDGVFSESVDWGEDLPACLARAALRYSGDLQRTVDATLGEVVSAGSLENLPTVTRRVVELAFLQVATMPNTGNANLSRSVAGARGDQNTFILDGMDVSDAQVGGT